MNDSVLPEPERDRQERVLLIALARGLSLGQHVFFKGYWVCTTPLRQASTKRLLWLNGQRRWARRFYWNDLVYLLYELPDNEHLLVYVGVKNRKKQRAAELRSLRKRQFSNDEPTEEQ